MEIAFLHRLNWGSGQRTDPAPLGNPRESRSTVGKGVAFLRIEDAMRTVAAVQLKVLFIWGCGLSGNQWKIASQRKTALTRVAPLTFRNPLKHRLSAKGNCNPKRNHAYQQGKLDGAWFS